MDKSLQSSLITSDHSHSSKVVLNTYLLYYHFLMIGAGQMIAWGTISTAFDWILLKFPEKNASAMLTFAISSPNVLIQPLTLWYAHLFSFNVKITGSFLAMGVLLAFTPFIIEYAPYAYELMIFVTVLIGAFNAVSLVSVFGLAGMMPDRYTGAAMAGNSFGGILMAVARMACLALLGHDKDSLLLSTIVYFTLGGVTLALCVLSQCLLMKQSLVKESIAKGSQIDSTEPVSLGAVFPFIRSYVLLVFSTFLITYAVFPTVTLATSSPVIPYSWLSSSLLLTSCVFDFIGRSWSASHSVTGTMLWVLVYVRLVFWGVFVLIMTSAGPEWLFNADWFRFANMALFMFSHGFVGTCGMMLAPASVKPAMKDKTGSVMSVALVWGVVSGSITGFLFTPLVQAQRASAFPGLLSS